MGNCTLGICWRKVVSTIDEAHEGKVASAVAVNGVKREWASAGADGE